MSTKDISRFLLQPRKHYTGMRMQQGRVLLDSDYNEGALHDDEDQRRTLVELIGAQGSPDGGFFIGYVQTNGPGGTPVPVTLGVEVGTLDVNINGSATSVPVPNFYVMPGSMYVGGLRVELEQPEHIALQSDFLQLQEHQLPPDISSSATVAHHFFFLHVWEQCVTAVEDEEILERALGGPDTSVRVRRMRRVEFAAAEEGENCATALANALADLTTVPADFDRATGELKSPGRLRITFLGGNADDTCAPCHPEPAGRYLGAENQAIRIQLADSGNFTWAFDNAAPLYRVTVTGAGNPPAGAVIVTMLTQPKDEEHWPLEGRVVEIVPWSAVLDNGRKVADEVGVFCRVSRSFDQDDKTFLIDPSDATAMAALADLVHAWDNDHSRIGDLGNGNEPREFFARFWHQTGPSTGVTIPINSGLALGSTGLLPTFPQQGLKGDFWIAALRPETPDKVVPFDLNSNGSGVPPHGPKHFYASIALVHSQDNHVTSVEDCRRHIVPATDNHCCTRIVGDGVHSFGQFQRIQDAINSLPIEGGRVCVRPGVYAEEISIVGLTGPVVLEGCGEQTVLVTPDSPVQPAVITIANVSQGVTVQALRIRAKRGAVGIFDGSNVRLVDLDIIEEDPVLGDGVTVALVRVLQASDVEMRSLRVDTIRTAVAPPDHAALQLEGNNLSLVESEITTRSRIAVDHAGDVARFEHLNIRQTSFPGRSPRSAIRTGLGSFEVRIDRCRLVIEGGFGEDAVIDISGGRFVIAENELITLAVSGPLAWGGAHIRSGDHIELRNNRIAGGAGHGVTLGSVLWQPEAGGATHREGAGRGQLRLDGLNTGDLRDGYPDLDLGVQFLALGDSPLEDVVIAGNFIENMQGNGVSALTVLGLRDDTALIDVRNLTIENNRIENNLIGPLFDSMRVVNDATPVGGSANGIQTGSGLEIPVLPYGGVVLSSITGRAIIRNNVISGNAFFNGPPVTQHAISGIFVLFGENLAITGNQIERNGDIPDAANTTSVRPGLRAGIGIAHATTGVQDSTFLDETFSGAIGQTVNAFALRVANNVVRQPDGRALFAVASGSVSVTANFLASQGFHGTNSPVDTVALGDVVFIQNLGAPWEGLTTEQPDNSARQPFHAQQYFTDTPGALQASPPNDVFFLGHGGHTLFDDNNVVYDWLVQRFPPSGIPLSYFAVTLISTDHVGMHGNQFAIRIDRSSNTSPPLVITPPTLPTNNTFFPEFLVANVFVMGATVHVTSNRFSEVGEALESVNLSLISYGFLLNTTALNQLTHCYIAANRGGFASAPINPGDSPTISGPSMVPSLFTIDQLNNVMFGSFVDHDFNSSAAPGSPCWPYLASNTNIWTLLTDFTRLVVDKRV